MILAAGCREKLLNTGILTNMVIMCKLMTMMMMMMKMKLGEQFVDRSRFVSFT
jgi:hypothetical protein